MSVLSAWFVKSPLLLILAELEDVPPGGVGHEQSYQDLRIEFAGDIDVEWPGWLPMM
jgi:hypothetical protein